MNCPRLLATLILLSICFRSQAGDPTPIIPEPMKVEARDGQFRLKSTCRIMADSSLKNEARLLAARLHASTSLPLKIKSDPAGATGGDIVLTTNGADAALGPEGYELTVTTNGVVVRAPQAAGIFYGTQSLLQLLPPEVFSKDPVGGITWTIPCTEISDSPRFAWRGFMLDVSRHFFTKTEVEQVLDLMALYKLNTFHWHLADDQGWRIQIKKYPRLTTVGAWRDGIGFHLDPKRTTAYDRHGRYGGYYTQKEIRAVVAYAAARHITIVPEIEMPGHSSAALVAYPQFLCPGITIPQVPNSSRGTRTGVYCAGNDATYAFLDDVLSEVAKLFPGKYIHIGGDEVSKSNWAACAECQLRIKTEHLKDERGLQAYFIRRIETIVNAHGKSLIGWSEIREGGIAPSATLMDWIGGGRESAVSGHDVVMTPQDDCYFDHYQSTNRSAEPKAFGGYLPLKQVYEFEPIPDGLALEFQTHVLGGQANLWTEYVPNLRQVEYMMFPRLGALSEVDWSPKEGRDWNDFQTRTALNEKRLSLMGVNYRPLAKPD